MKVLAVVSHPRQDSLTHAVTKEFTNTLIEQGHEVDILDLHGEGFDPRMTVADEPDWEDSNKKYSATVQKEMDRLNQYDALAVVFPVWWWGLPAMLKGWLDRVWNQGYAYGGSKLQHKKIMWIGLAAAEEQDFSDEGFGKALEMQLVQGASRYCGIEDASLEILCETLGDDEVRNNLLARTRELAGSFA